MSQASESGPNGSDEIQVSCRLPVLAMFVSASIWLVIGSIFSLIASIKFHSPAFLSDFGWLTYGRVRPAANNSFLYGFCLQAGLGFGLWLIATLGRVRLPQGWLITTGAKIWNLGVTAGVIAILAGEGTSFENLDMPRYAAIILFLSYVIIGAAALFSLHERAERPLAVPQWFILAALFWFPWIYSTANLLLFTFPARGVAQAALGWWYSANLQVVWLGLVGLAAVLYLLPKLTSQELENRPLASFIFWFLILCGSWTGMPNSAPLPAWMPALSTSATVLTLILLVTVALSIYQTLEGKCSRLVDGPVVRFIGVGIIAFLIGGLMNIFGSLLDVSRITDLTWFTTARLELNSFGFFGMVLFGAIYFIVPRLTGTEFPWPKLIRAHFWLALLGIIFSVLPFAVGGLVQGFRLQDPGVPFMDVVKSTLPFLRASTIGDLLIATGNLVFFLNLARMVNQFYRERATSVYASVTADLWKSAGAKP